MRRYIIPLTLFLFTAALRGQQLITTLANTSGFCGFSGDGGPAASASLCNAQASAVDASGNVYFSDTGTLRIRKITPAGIISTIAGNGSYGDTGDGGPATAASLGYIRQVAVDPAGQHLCFGDTSAHKIRCVFLATGVIQGYGTGNSTTSGDGGNVANAGFNAPEGAAFDNAGNFYVSDFGDNRVRIVNMVTGIINTFAGPGPGYCCAPTGDGGLATSANLYEPLGLWVWNGGLYIADQGNARVRRVDLATNIITTVAGNGVSGSSGDGGPALSASIGAAWIALDGAGNLFLSSGTAVRMVDLTGTINTIAGTSGISGFGADDIPATQTYFGGIGGIGWDPVALRLLIGDQARLRQIFYTPPTTTVLTVTPNPAVPGSVTTLQATVAPAGATGSVRFYQDNLLLGSAALSNGTATFTWTAPLGGYASYGMRAVYGGDPTHNLSSSPTVNVPVQQGTTITTISSSANPSLQGQTVTFTATVTPSAATGTVEFYGGPSAGSAPLVNGLATFSISNFTPGSYSMTAHYDNSPSYLGSTSSALVQVVKAPTTTALTSSPNPSAFGQTVTFTATVTPATATGTVQFLKGSVVLGSASLSGGRAQFSTSALPAGANPITATYSGDSGNAASTSATVTQTVNKISSTVTLAASPASQATAGQTVTLTATVSPSSATGTVQFLDGSTVIGSVPLVSGKAAFSTSTLSAGNHSFKAVYGGDGNVNGSQSSTLSYKVKH
jgi:hypothetical protein